MAQVDTSFIELCGCTRICQSFCSASSRAPVGREEDRAWTTASLLGSDLELEGLLPPSSLSSGRLVPFACRVPGISNSRKAGSLSQNHRITGIGRDLCGSSSPTLLPKQGRLQQAAQDLVQAGHEYLQRRRLHNLPGQPVPVLRHPQREEVLPHVQTELPVLQFVPIAPCPVTGHY